MASIFTKIISGDIPSYKVLEDNEFYAFLDINPIAKGHCLLVPKKEVDYLFDLDDITLANMHVFAKKIAVAMDKVFDCKRIGTAVVGLEVPHAHMHLIPLNDIYDIDFKRPKLKFTDEEFKNIAASIAQKI